MLSARSPRTVGWWFCLGLSVRKILTPILEPR